ncbi:MAG: hydrogen peroxide-inducible genes activator [Bdellovibrionales bacterium]|nr:hydrogen peroxide-inducible genes activator [Bdellovibrionales bacterium]
MEYILAVNNMKHFGRASEHCNVSQPSLSMQIQKAEDELGVIIFDRHKKPIQATPQGRQIVEQAQRLMNEYKRLLKVSSEESDTLKGSFRLGVIPTLAASVIPLFVKEFSHSFPNVDLTITELTTENIIRAIKNNEIEAGVLATPLHEPQIEEQVLFYESFSVYCSEEHPLLKKKNLGPKDLDNRNDIWILSDGHCFKNQVLNFCSINQNLSTYENIHFQSGNLETLKLLVDQAQGYTFLPQLTMDRLSPKDKKRVRPFSSPVPSREVSLVSRKDHWQQEILKALFNTIVNNLPRGISNKKTETRDILSIEGEIDEE